MTGLLMVSKLHFGLWVVGGTCRYLAPSPPAAEFAILRTPSGKWADRHDVIEPFHGVTALIDRCR